MRLKILILGDGNVPSLYKNYRADPLAKYLSKMGHKITVLCPKPRITDKNYSKHYNTDMQDTAHVTCNTIFQEKLKQSSLYGQMERGL